MQWIMIALVAFNFFLIFLLFCQNKEKEYYKILAQNAKEQAEEILTAWEKASRKNAEHEIKLMEAREK